MQKFLHWVWSRKKEFLILIGIYALSSVLSVVFDSTEKTNFGDYSVIVAYYALGFFFLPISISKILLPIHDIFSIVSLIAYWPVLITLIVLYLKFRKWVYLLPIIVLIILPAFKIAEVFVGAMSV